MNDSLISKLREAAPKAFSGNTVLFAYLFGSKAIGRERPDSDIDVAVYLEPGTPSDRYLSISLELVEDLTKASGLGFIEVTILNDAPLPLKGRVLSQRITIFSRDEPLRVRYESATSREFLDFQIHAKVMDEQFLRDIARGRR